MTLPAILPLLFDLVLPLEEETAAVGTGMYVNPRAGGWTRGRRGCLQRAYTACARAGRAAVREARRLAQRRIVVRKPWLSRHFNYFNGLIRGDKIDKDNARMVRFNQKIEFVG
jgi:hypothetical protein